MTTSRVPGVIGIGSAVIGAAALLSAQDPGRPSFEVASVKPHKSVEQTSSSVVQPGGRYTATNATLRMLMRTAYGAHDDQIIGGPNWTSSERFDIVGKAEGNPPTTTFRIRDRRGERARCRPPVTPPCPQRTKQAQPTSNPSSRSAIMS
jgi:hypothetical protein